MSLSANKLGEIAEQVTATFTDHPYIKVNLNKGTPAEHYQVTYTVRGLVRDDKGEVTETTSHIVELSIPFGYPHFPPSCKPKSDTFHPDFDPAALCLGSFWNQERTLPELIIHIGRMINGEEYSTTNAFNEDAAEFYRKHKERFPLAEINWYPEESPIIEETEDGERIDTLEASDLETDLDFLSLESSSPPSNLMDELSSSDTGMLDEDYIHLLERQGNYQQLAEYLTGREKESAQAAKLLQNAKEKVREAKKLQKAGKNKEKENDTKGALQLYEKAAELVADLPQINTDINRMQQALDLLQDLVTEDETPVYEQQPLNVEEEQKTEGKRRKTATKEAPPAAKQPTAEAKLKSSKESSETFFTAPPTRKPLYALLGVIIAACVGTAGYGYYFVQQNWSGATAKNLQCQQLMDQFQFDQAAQMCRESLAHLNRVYVLYSLEKTDLESQLNQRLSSEQMVQGLAGKVLVEGRYVPRDLAQRYAAASIKKKTALENLNSQNWQEAIDVLIELTNQIKEDAALGELLDQPQLLEATATAKLELKFVQAAELAGNNDWSGADRMLNEAKALVEDLGKEERLVYRSRVDLAIADYRFDLLKSEGDSAFAQAQWQDAISAYQAAIAAIPNDGSASPELRKALGLARLKAELYMTIDRGNKFFAANDWEPATRAYQEAIEMLAQPESHQLQVDVADITGKLERVILQANLIRDRQQVREMLENKDLAGAKKVYSALMERIESSHFRQEREFSAMLEEIQLARKALDHELYLQAKEEYLVNNYASIFQQAYPSTSEKNLSNPVITLIREEDQRLIYKLQCKEAGHGRPLTLVMYYAFDKTSQRWSFHSEAGN